MLFSSHVSQALLASLSLLPFPVALAKPIATTSAPAGLETTSVDVWRPLNGWEPLDEAPTALDRRNFFLDLAEGTKKFERRFRVVAGPAAVVNGPISLYAMGSECKNFAKNINGDNGVKCVSAVMSSAFQFTYGALFVTTVVFVYAGAAAPLKSRSNFLSFEDDKPDAPFPAIEASPVYF